MRQIDTSNLGNQNISSYLLVHTHTADADRAIFARVHIDQVAGNGDYSIYATIQAAGTGAAYMEGPITTFAVPSGQTSIGFISVLVPVNNTDVVKFYVKGLAGDTTTPDIVTRIFELTYLRPTTAGRTLNVSAGSGAEVEPTTVRSAVGMASANLDTQLADLDTEMDATYASVTTLKAGLAPFTGSVLAGSTTSSINTNLTATAVNTPYRGTLLVFTSGALNGYAAAINACTNGANSVFTPLELIPTAPTVGDTFVLLNVSSKKIVKWLNTLGADNKPTISTDAQDLSTSLSVNAKLLNGATPHNAVAPDNASISAILADVEHATYGLSALLTAIGTRLASTGYTAPPNVTSIADAIWDELMSGHVVDGSAGNMLSEAGTPPPTVDAIAAAMVRVLTQLAIPSVTAPNKTLMRGDTWSVTWTDMGDLSDVDEVWLTVKDSDTQLDDNARLMVSMANGLLVWNGVDEGLTATNASVAITDEATGTVVATVKPAQTVIAVVGVFVYDVQVKFGDGRIVTPANAVGRWFINADVTRDIQ